MGSEREASEASDTRFRAAVEGSLDAFFVLTCVRDDEARIVDFTFADLNRRGAEVLGLPREAILGQRLCELRPVNRAAGFFDRYLRVFETGEILEEETVVALPDGGRKWVHHQVVPLPDGVAITSRDVTRYRKLEADLRDALDRAEGAAAELLAQRETILALSAPVIEAWVGVLALPIIGALDEARAGQIMDRLLDDIVRRRARFVILDLTGAVVADATPVVHLLALARAAALLGCRCLLSGISGEVARALVESGAEVTGLPTFARLREALRHALRAGQDRLPVA